MESIGTALLLAVIVGSGIMGERLSAGNAAVALLANSIATGAGLYPLTVTLGPIFGSALQSRGVVDQYLAGRSAASSLHRKCSYVHWGTADWRNRGDIVCALDVAGVTYSVRSRGGFLDDSKRASEKEFGGQGRN